MKLFCRRKDCFGRTSRCYQKWILRRPTTNPLKLRSLISINLNDSLHGSVNFTRLILTSLYQINKDVKLSNLGMATPS